MSSDTEAKSNGAMPAHSVVGNDSSPLYSHYGLSKRELFAAMAMQGLTANSVPGDHHVSNICAAEAVAMADALLEALEQQ